MALRPDCQALPTSANAKCRTARRCGPAPWPPGQASTPCHHRSAARSPDVVARQGAAIERSTHLLRLAAGAAATRLVGNDTLRLLEDAADQAHALDDAAAAQDLGWMVIYMGQAPGIVAVLPDQEQVDRWLDAARIATSGSVVAEATVAAADVARLPDTDPAVLELTTRAIDLACSAAAPLVQSAALDRLSSYHLAHADIAEALDAVRRRCDVLATVPLDASSGFQFNDYLLMASEIDLAAGNLALAAHHTDTLAELTCYREQGYPAIARRIKVDAIAGDLERAVTGGERFLIAWERAGRPRASTLNTATYAMTMVHGLLDDERRRRQCVDGSMASTGQRTFRSLSTTSRSAATTPTPSRTPTPPIAAR